MVSVRHARQTGVDATGRDGPDFPFMQHLVQLIPDGLYGDITAAADYLRSSYNAITTRG